MIYVARFWDQDFRGSSLEEIHRIACEEQETTTPEYQVKTYESEMDYILKDLPQEFRAFVSHYAWDQGHSAGQDEVNGIARELASDLKKPIYEYTKRISGR